MLESPVAPLDNQEWLAHALLSVLIVVVGALWKKINDQHKELREDLNKELADAHDEIMILRERSHELSNHVQQIQGELNAKKYHQPTLP